MSHPKRAKTLEVRQSITLRKSVRKGHALCAICRKHTADMFASTGKPICHRHIKTKVAA